MGEKIVLDPHRMFKQACAFSDCARCCEIEPNNIIEYRFNSHTVSGIVNSAFACEVFIKTLLVIHDVSVKEMRGKKACDGHDLKKLWVLLKEKDCETTTLVELKMQEFFRSPNKSIFDELLESISNTFDYWRYIYEKDDGNINLNFLRIFRLLLREVCCEQLYDKTWKEYIG
ncbi:hypothetical protein DFR60_108131 [Hungatella effluvii]|uniref:HEPN domain-containing protein n=1 Tax=Hungatella effluvii TaxID=1096246 RepID=A0A2V3Y4Z9_9FIRM|nr:hypothetical protein [Hungatella effluvii]PXX52046.1 hypothetical protein DFR60_108131 [Hungatella effluvii]